MDYERVNIRILGFESYSHRKDVTYKSYFILRNNTINSPEFNGTSGSAIKLFLMLLSYSIGLGKDVISVHLAYYYGLLNCSLADCKRLLNELEKNNFIELQRKIRTKSVRINELTNELTSKSGENSVFSDDSFALSVVDLWNDGAPRHGLAQIKKSGKRWPKRLELLKELCAYYKTIDDWKGIFAVASEKGFVRADGKPWTPHFEYALRKADLFFEESKEGEVLDG